jgi:hypothetical protein
MCCVALSSFGQIYVEDDFEDAAKSENIWEIITGEWQVADGVFHQLAQGDAWLVAMIAPDKWDDGWTEYTVEVSGTQLEAGDHPLQILFRVQDPVPLVWADRTAPQTHLYRWIINGWTNTLCRPYIYNGGTSTMLAEAPLVLEIGQFYHFKLEVTKTGFKGYVDDVEMFDVENSEWIDGRVGLQSFSGMADFDDFIVYGPSGTAVGPQGKLAVTWAAVKAK